MTMTPGTDQHMGEMLTLYAIGALSPQEVRFIQHHLLCCRPCDAEHKRIAAVVNLLSLIPETEFADHRKVAARRRSRRRSSTRTVAMHVCTGQPPGAR